MAGVPVRFDTEALKTFGEQAGIAPKIVLRAVRREFKRAGKTFVTKARRALLFGPPGIFLPATGLQRSTRGKSKGQVKAKKGRAGDVKRVQQAHIKAKTGGKTDIFLAAYTSQFLAFHEARIRNKFLGLFRGDAKAILGRVEKEAFRQTERLLKARA